MELPATVRALDATPSGIGAPDAQIRHLSTRFGVGWAACDIGRNIVGRGPEVATRRRAAARATRVEHPRDEYVA
jgi:hypothetical protein